MTDRQLLARKVFVGAMAVAFVIAMMLIVLALTFFAKAAHAAEVTPAKQALLDKQGWSIADEEADEPTVQPKVGECRTKRLGTYIKNWKGETLVGHRVKWHGCAAHGRFFDLSSTYAHSSPSVWWSHVWGPHVERWHWDRQDGILGEMEWRHRSGGFDQYWDGRVKLGAKIDGDHQIWFPIKRRIWG